MVQLVWLKSIQNGVVFALSVVAFIVSMKFYNSTENVILPEAPKAT